MSERNDDQLFLKQGGQMYVVQNRKMLRQWIAERRVDPDDQVSTGDRIWVRADRFEDLGEHFTALREASSEAPAETATREPESSQFTVECPSCQEQIKIEYLPAWVSASGRPFPIRCHSCGMITKFTLQHGQLEVAADPATQATDRPATERVAEPPFVDDDPHELKLDESPPPPPSAVHHPTMLHSERADPPALSEAMSDGERVSHADGLVPAPEDSEEEPVAPDEVAATNSTEIIEPDAKASTGEVMSEVNGVEAIELVSRALRAGKIEKAAARVALTQLSAALSEEDETDAASAVEAVMRAMIASNEAQVADLIDQLVDDHENELYMVELEIDVPEVSDEELAAASAPPPAVRPAAVATVAAAPAVVAAATAIPAMVEEEDTDHGSGDDATPKSTPPSAEALAARLALASASLASPGDSDEPTMEPVLDTNAEPTVATGATSTMPTWLQELDEEFDEEPDEEPAEPPQVSVAPLDVPSRASGVVGLGAAAAASITPTSASRGAPPPQEPSGLPPEESWTRPEPAAAAPPPPLNPRPGAGLGGMRPVPADEPAPAAEPVQPEVRPRPAGARNDNVLDAEPAAASAPRRSWIWRAASGFFTAIGCLAVVAAAAFVIFGFVGGAGYAVWSFWPDSEPVARAPQPSPVIAPVAPTPVAPAPVVEPLNCSPATTNQVGSTTLVMSPGGLAVRLQSTRAMVDGTCKYNGQVVAAICLSTIDRGAQASRATTHCPAAQRL